MYKSIRFRRLYRLMELMRPLGHGGGGRIPSLSHRLQKLSRRSNHRVSSNGARVVGNLLLGPKSDLRLGELDRVAD